MKPTERRFAAIVASSVFLFGGCGRTEQPSVNASAAETAAGKIARGQHLVEGIGACNDCHTPTGANGEPDPTQLLMGATLPFRPTIEIPWTEIAPAIAGLPTMSDEQAVRFFMTGDRPGGVPARPPMPRYRMTRDEAEAVVAYLRSLSTQQ